MKRVIKAYAFAKNGKLCKTWYGLSSWCFGIFTTEKMAKKSLIEDELCPNDWEVIPVEIHLRSKKKLKK